jgi:1-acyl-sn-glycerol-3-phosphate acyltransferase
VAMGRDRVAKAFWRILPPVRPAPVYSLIAVASMPVLYGLFRLRARGVDRLPEGGFVLASNHISNLDPWPLGLPLYPKRFLRFMAKSELYWWPLRYALRGGGAFPVRRGEKDLEAIETAVRLCREGHVVVMFPEGTRRRKGLRKKWQPRAHSGAARIALEANVPLVPAAVKGTDRLARLGPLRVVYGEPVDVDGLTPQDATDKLMARIHELEASL